MHGIVQTAQYTLSRSIWAIVLTVPPPPAPPPPTQCYLGYAYARSLFLKAPPIWGLPTFSNPPFAGFSRAFPALETPLNQEKCSMYPPKFGIISQEYKEMREKKKKHPLFKEISGWKVKYTPFFTILGPDFVARKVPLYRTFWHQAWGHSDPWVGGGGRACPSKQSVIVYSLFSQRITRMPKRVSKIRTDHNNDYIIQICPYRVSQVHEL